jgi:predicted protein tyrosine phosphatase
MGTSDMADPGRDLAERARSAAARMCAAARVLARHLDDTDVAKRAVLLSHIEAAEDELRLTLGDARLREAG